ncbi:MAG: hypothetical protein AAF962_08235 [Actinomycetota bacterium]
MSEEDHAPMAPTITEDGDDVPVARRRRRWLRWRLLVPVVLAIGGAAAGIAWTQTPEICRTETAGCGRVLVERVSERVGPPEEPDESQLEVVAADHEIEFYGMQYPTPGSYGTMQDLNIDTILIDFAIGAGPEEWMRQLDEADAAGLRVVAWLWTPGWVWDDAGEQWIINDEGRSFLTTVEGHPALLAVYGTHEAYWNECFGCGYNTAQLQMLYRQIKEIADVPIYSAFDGFAFWEDFSDETTFSDGICDYCDTWYYPVLADGTYDRAEYINRLREEVETFRELAPNSKFVWVLQSFSSELSGRSLPDEEELADMAELAARVDIDGIWWYVWSFDQSQYQEVLGGQPELHDVVRESHELFHPLEEGGE